LAIGLDVLALDRRNGAEVVERSSKRAKVVGSDPVGTPATGSQHEDGKESRSASVYLGQFV
jgi:hypothetical protein